MTDKDFTASNGWTVIPNDSEGDTQIRNTDGVLMDYVMSESVGPLREYFQAERDKELGRWRDPEHPDFVVYSNSGSKDRNILDEKAGTVFYTIDDKGSPDSMWEDVVVLYNYLEAHKPKRCKANTMVLGSRLDCAGDVGHYGIHYFEDADSGALTTWVSHDAV